MNHWDSDINDDEIRIISSDSNSPKEEKDTGNGNGSPYGYSRRHLS